MRSYKDIALWAQLLGNKARSRFQCRKRNGCYEVPSHTVIRNALVKDNPEQLNHYLNFPYVRQAFLIERESIRKKTGEISREVVYGVTSTSVDHATPEQVLRDNRWHWSIESCHYIIDWNYDEDRSQIRTGLGPENITRLRRFAIGLLKDKKRNEKTDAEYPSSL